MTSRQSLRLAQPYIMPFCWQVEDQWYEVENLRVVDILPQVVALSETYMQVHPPHSSSHPYFNTPSLSHQ